jgi:hypothetical protein
MRPKCCAVCRWIRIEEKRRVHASNAAPNCSNLANHNPQTCERRWAAHRVTMLLLQCIWLLNRHFGADLGESNLISAARKQRQRSRRRQRALRCRIVARRQRHSDTAALQMLKSEDDDVL